MILNPQEPPRVPTRVTIMRMPLRSTFPVSMRGGDLRCG